MLAKHRLMQHLQATVLCIWITFEVAVNPHPVHFAATAHFVAAHSCNIVFCVAAHNTSSATGTSIQVNGHCPVVAFFIMDIPKGDHVMRRRTLVASRLMLDIFSKCRFLRNEVTDTSFDLLALAMTTFSNHIVTDIGLRFGHFNVFASRSNRHSSRMILELAIGSADERSCICTHTFGNLADNVSAAPTQCDGNRIISLSLIF